MKLNSYTLAALVFIILFGGIGISSAMNWWQTESTKEPVRYAVGDAAGEYNPADIRGSYTFGEVSDLFGVPLVDLQTAFGLPGDADPAAYPLKSLEDLYASEPVEIGTGSVRVFVAFYRGLPYDLNAAEDTYLLPDAVAILRANGKMLPEQAAYLQTHIAGGAVEPSAPTEPAAAAPAVQPSAEPEEHVEGSGPVERSVTGKTTFQNLLDWGVTQERIVDILGEPMPAAGTVIKDYLSLKGLEFSALKAQFQAAVDEAE